MEYEYDSSGVKVVAVVVIVTLLVAGAVAILSEYQDWRVEMAEQETAQALAEIQLEKVRLDHKAEMFQMWSLTLAAFMTSDQFVNIVYTVVTVGALLAGLWIGVQINKYRGPI